MRVNRILNHLNSDNIVSLLVLLAGIGICLALFFTTISKEKNHARLNFKLSAEETTSSIENSIIENSTTVGAVASLFSASGEVDRHGFSVFVRPFLNRNKSIQALQWVPHVLDNERERYETSARRDGLLDFHFMEWQKPHVLKIASVRKDYFVVYYNEPLLPNRFATGLDNGSEPVRHTALLDSAMNGSETYSPPIALLQSTARQKGYLVYQPVYTHPIQNGHPQERLKHLRGFAAGVFIMDKVLQSAVGHQKTGSIYLEVIDVTDPKHEQTIGSIGTKGTEIGNMFYDRFYKFGHRRWCFHTVPGISYTMPSPFSAWIKLALSLTLVLIIFIFLLYRSSNIRILQEKEERFNQLTEQSRTVIWDVNAEGMYTYFSDVSEIVFGYRADEIIGKQHFYDIHPEEGREAFKTAAFGVFARKEPFKNLENTIQTKDGSVVWVSTNGVPILDNNGILLGYRGSDTDINERKQVENALRESDERFSNAFEYAPIGMALISLEGNWLKVNQAICDIIGYSKNELLLKTFQDITHPDDLRTNLVYVQKLLSGNITTYKMEKRYYHKLGHLVWVLLAVSMVRDSMGNPLYFISQIEDITERKRAEDALARIEEKQNAMISNISDVIGIICLDGTIEYKSPNIEKYFGWHPQDLVGSDCWLTVHPDDLERIQKHFYALLENDHSVVEIEYQYKCKDGSYKPVRLTATNLVNDPIINGVLLNYHDITDRRLAEDALLDGERRYRLLWESASEGFGLHELITDANGVAVNYRILDVNPVFESITGVPADEVVGKLATEVYGTDEPPYLEVYARVATTGIAEYFETHFGLLNRHFEISVFSPSLGQFATAFSDISERKAHEDMLSYQSTHDALTSLPNRLFFERHLGEILKDNSGRRSRSMAILFLDLDNFKMVNDTMGHKAGDELLKETATRLSQCLRTGDILARIGGDEFTILLHDIWAKDDAAIVAQRILQTIAQPFEVAGCKLVIGVSIGVSIYPDNAADVDGLLKSADAAMYKAKELGRNNCQFFSDEISQANEARVEMERDLRSAIELDELKVYYQPITDIRTMRITGAEALLRWDHPKQGMISPGLFVPLAEETGLILPMGRMVLETACKQGKTWHDAGYTDFEISVNVSPAQLSDIGFISEVHGALSDSGFPPNCLKLEVTETVLAKNDNDEVDLLSILKSLGISICLDDFGIGYSSLSRLNKLPIALMKIDGYFIRNIACSLKDRAMTESIIVMAHNLGIKVTAEWIEDEDQMEIIKSLNCDYAQGYLVSPALSAEDFSNFLRAWTTKLEATNAA